MGIFSYLKKFRAKQASEPEKLFKRVNLFSLLKSLRKHQAKQKQLKILKQGVKVWNHWKREHFGKEINLFMVDLSGVDLSDIDLSVANLSGAKLIRADLSKAVLFKAFLDGANLIQTQLREANITGGAYFYGTAREDWIIDGILCDYVFWDEEGKQRTPKDRNFQPGEFEELYKHLPTFEYIFEHGVTLIDIGIINQIVNDIRALHPDWELKIDSFHSRGQPHANFTIREKDLIAQAFNQIKTKYEETLNRLKGQYEESNRILSEVVKELTNKPQLMITGNIIMGDKRIGRDNIEISGQAQVNQLTTGNSGNDTSDSTE
jgi:hypothetical protein